MKRNTKVGLVTSGGDCQGLNAAIRGVGKALFSALDTVEIYVRLGFHGEGGLWLKPIAKKEGEHYNEYSSNGHQENK